MVAVSELRDPRTAALPKAFAEAGWRPGDRIPDDAIEAIQRLPRFEMLHDLRHPMHIVYGQHEAFAAVHKCSSKDPSSNRLFAFIRNDSTARPPRRIGVSFDLDPEPVHVGKLAYESSSDPAPPAAEQSTTPDETWRFHVGPTCLTWRGVIDQPAVSTFMAEVRELLKYGQLRSVSRPCRLAATTCRIIPTMLDPLTRAPLPRPIQSLAPAAAVHRRADHRRRRRGAAGGDRGVGIGGGPAAHQGHDRPVEHLVRPGRHRGGAAAGRTSIESHISDTKIGGAGLCDDEAVRITVEEGPQRVLELLSWGINFDKKAGNPYDLAFTREGGHGFARILHAYGDATGRELAQTLINTVRGRENIRVSERSFVIDLITDEDRCLGRAGVHQRRDQRHLGEADDPRQRRGGAALSRDRPTRPSRPPTATRWRTAPGAAMQDMEMVQFHPTTLYVAGSSRR